MMICEGQNDDEDRNGPHLVERSGSPDCKH